MKTGTDNFNLSGIAYKKTKRNKEHPTVFISFCHLMRKTS